MPAPRTLDERIAALVPEVDAASQEGLRSALRTLRDSNNPVAVLLGMSRLSLRLLNQLFRQIGHKRPSENLFDCIVTAARGDAGSKIKGLHILPDEMASYLHTIRTLSNKADHDAENIRLTEADAENALSLFLRVLEWFYGEFEHGPRLPTIYSSEAAPPIAHAYMLETFLRSQQATEAEKRLLADELERLRAQQAADERRRMLGRERVVGPMPGAVVGHFKDRAPELRFLRERLVADARVRLLLVCGRGGIGKTALITKLLHELQEDLAPMGDAAPSPVDSMVYVSLRQPEFRAPDKIAELICRTLASEAAAELRAKWQEKTSLPDKLEFLFRRTLLTWRCLIVLDNFEDILDDDNRIRDEYADLRQLVEKCLEWDHAARMVATSRRTLVLPPELEGRVAERKVELPLDEGLPEAEAVTLLCELDVDGRLGIRDMSGERVRAVVRLCHGIPRTLETLVGTLRQRRTLTLTGLLGDEAAFARLTDNPARELYESLPRAAQLVVQALATYDRPVPAAAIRFLLPALGVDDILDVLVRNYVVTYDRDRFSLHPLDQQYAYRQVPDADGDYGKLALHSRAAEFFRLLRKPRAAWKTVDDLEPQLQEFHHLVRAGLPDLACSLLNEIDNDHLSRWGYFALVIKLRSQLVDLLTDQKLQQTNWGRLGMAHWVLGELRRAIECHEKALTMAREVGDRGGEGVYTGNLGNAHRALGQVRQAIEYYEQALAIAREVGDRREEAIWLGCLGNASNTLGQVRQAIERYEQALAIAQEIGDRREEAIWLGGLGNAYRTLGEVRRAIECSERALTIAREIGDRRGESIWLGNLGTTHRATGQVGQAIECYEQALAIAREIGDRRGESRQMGNLGNAYCALGEVRRGVESYEQTLAIVREVGDREEEGVWLGNLGNAYGTLGEPQRALVFHEQSLAIAREVGDRQGEAIQLCELGNAYRTLGDTQQAIQLYDQALVIAREVGDKRSQSEVLLGLGTARYDLGNLVDARRCYEESMALDIPSTNYGCAVRWGMLCLREDKPAEAQDRFTRSVALCQALLEKDPALYDALYLLALTQLGSGHPDEALAVYRQALRACSAKGVVENALQDVRSLHQVAPATRGIQAAIDLLHSGVAEGQGATPAEGNRRCGSDGNNGGL